jgi:hypothetical protein
MSKVKTIKRIVSESDRLFRVSLPTDNPYEENTQAWHCFIDVSCSVGVGVNAPDLLSLASMMDQHEQTVEYYENNLGRLIRDGILKESYAKHIAKQQVKA